MTNAIKNEVTNTVKKEDSKIKTVYVTADADSVTRIKKFAADIAKGRPVSGFINELNEIGRRVTPSAK
jgi:YhcN/YlaJ family sporulation lipoprotein